MSNPNRSLLFAGLGLLAVSCAATPHGKKVGTFALTSPQIANGKPMTVNEEFNGFDAKGKNLSPALNWSGAPAETKSYAITVYDPDAPTGSGWWHWVAVNIPANTHGLPQGAGTDFSLRPLGMRQIRNDYGTLEFGGACPPKGDPAHHYVFTVWALDIGRLDLPENASPALVGFMLNQHVLAKAQLTALYAR